jgi:hypothetical protein
MNHKVSLELELLEQAADSLRFRLAVRNCSSVKLLFPYPEIRGLRFGNKASRQESEWYTQLLVSASWAGFTLQPGGIKAIEYRVRPCAVESPAEDDHTDYFRWCVELPAGEYLAWFRFQVDEDYFCGDSHYHYEDLLREAESERAIVWTGEARSNRVHLARAEQAAAADGGRELGSRVFVAARRGRRCSAWCSAAWT